MHGSDVTDPHGVGQPIWMRVPGPSHCFAERLSQEVIAGQRFNCNEFIAMRQFELRLQPPLVDVRSPSSEVL
jgi:hypothetical protein